ncbi:MAG: ankyrin repeat protein, partial [bacterium]
KFVKKDLKKNISDYLSTEVVDEAHYISSEVLTAIQEGDTSNLSKIVPNASLNNCLDLETHERSAYIVVAIYENSLSSVKHFVESGADIEHICENKTPLMSAAKYGRLETVKYLIEQGAVIERKSIKGKTALSYAFQYKRPEVAAYIKDQIAKSTH